MKKFKLVAIVLSLMFVCSAFSHWELPVIAATNDAEQYMTGLLHSDPEVSKQYEDTSKLTPNELKSLTTKHDLTEEYSEYIPTIIDQGSLNSCTAVACVYYAYTYAANKTNSTTTTAKNAYSPKWAYNALNGAANAGVYIEDVFNFLSEHGSLRQEDFPYVGNASNPQNYTELPSASLADKMLEALSTRFVTAGMHFSRPTGIYKDDNNNINGVEEFLNKVKYEISSGNMLIVPTMIHAWDAVYVNDTIGYVGIRTSNTQVNGDDGGWHAITIVGYDDDMWVDINQNNIKDEGEVGAFKLANSWGATWNFKPDGVSSTNQRHEGDGYFWIAYDSLYKISQVDEGNWEDGRYNNTRLAAFSYDNKENECYTVRVTQHKVDYVVQIIANASNRGELQVDIGSSPNSSTDASRTLRSYYPSTAMGSLSCNNIALIYQLEPQMMDNMDNTTPYFLTNIYNYIQVSGADSVDIDIVDNMGNRVVTDTISIDFSFSGKLITYQNSAVQKMGDLNYNGMIDLEDLNILGNNLANPRTYRLSDLQTRLADLNKNNIVDYDDLRLMMDQLTSWYFDSAQHIIDTATYI